MKNQKQKARRIIKRAIRMLESGGTITAQHLLREALDVLRERPTRVAKPSVAAAAILATCHALKKDSR